MENQGSASLFEMEIDNYAQNHINTISRWGRFIAITILIVLGLSILLMVLIGQRFVAALSDYMPGTDLGNGDITSDQVKSVLWVIFAVFLVYMLLLGAWCYFMLRASSLFKKGLITRNVVDISDGFASLRNMFIVSIVIAALSALSKIYSMLNF